MALTCIKGKVIFPTYWDLLYFNIQMPLDATWNTPYLISAHESRLSIFRGSAGPQLLRIFWSLAMAEFSEISFTQLMW